MDNKFERFELIALSRLREIIRNDYEGKELDIIEEKNDMTEKEMEDFLSYLFHFEMFKGSQDEQSMEN